MDPVGWRDEFSEHGRDGTVNHGPWIGKSRTGFERLFRPPLARVGHMLRLDCSQKIVCLMVQIENKSLKKEEYPVQEPRKIPLCCVNFKY